MLIYVKEIETTLQFYKQGSLYMFRFVVNS